MGISPDCYLLDAYAVASCFAQKGPKRFQYIVTDEIVRVDEPDVFAPCMFQSVIPGCTYARILLVDNANPPPSNRAKTRAESSVEPSFTQMIS